MNLPGKVTNKVKKLFTDASKNSTLPKEIEEMIVTVDKNKDGKINYSEFRVSFSSLPVVCGTV